MKLLNLSICNLALIILAIVTLQFAIIDPTNEEGASVEQCEHILCAAMQKFDSASHSLLVVITALVDHIFTWAFKEVIPEHSAFGSASSLLKLGLFKN